MSRTYVDITAEYYDHQEEILIGKRHEVKPRFSQEQRNSKLYSPRSLQEKNSERKGGMRTILVVDDERNIRNVFHKHLSRHGYNVLTASSAVKARDIMLGEKIHLVLLDINMAKVDGVAFSEWIKAFQKNVIVIISSVYPVEDQKEKIRWANDYYDKSEGLRTLLNKIRFQLKSPAKSKKVLIIDDEYSVRDWFSSLLERSGYEAVSFADNKSALQFLKNKNNRIDLLILDISMPNIDGAHFHEMIKMKHTETKVLVASSYPLETQQFFIFDADDYFDKSDGNQTLLEKISSLI